MRPPFLAQYAPSAAALLPSDWFVGDPGPWCERDRGEDAFLREPSNALSDLCFLAISLHMARCAAVDAYATDAPLGSLRAAPAREALFAFANAIHFCGTFWNHSCRCHGGHVLDVFGMLGVLAFLSLHKGCQILDRRRGEPVPFALFAAAYAALTAALWPYCQLFYADAACEFREVAFFLGALAPALLAEIPRPRAEYTGRGRTLFAVALAALVSGFACQSLDQPRHVGRRFCAPASPCQLHAAWHVLTALAALCIFEAQREAAF